MISERQKNKIESLRGDCSGSTCSYLNRIYIQETNEQLIVGACCCPGNDHSIIINKFYQWYDTNKNKQD